jgi:hypothetical protein
MYSVRVQTTPDDLAAFSMHATLTDPSAQANGLQYGYSMALAAAPLTGWMVAAISKDTRAGLLVAGLMVALMLLTGGQWWRSDTRRRTNVYAHSGKLGIPGPAVVTLEDDGLLESCPEVSSRYAWIGIDGVEELPDYVFIRLKGNRGMILPKRGQADVISSFGRAVAEALAAHNAQVLGALGPVEQAHQPDSRSLD